MQEQTSPNNNNHSNENPNLEVITRVILIFGILFVGGGILYVSTRPEDPDLFFFLLNEDLVMRDYPNNITAGESVIFHAYVENLLGDPAKFSVRVYNTSDDYWINSSIGVANSPDVTFQEEQIKEIDNSEQWITDSFEIQFFEENANQIIILELWQFVDDDWVYIPDFLLTLRIEIL